MLYYIFGIFGLKSKTAHFLKKFGTQLQNNLGLYTCFIVYFLGLFSSK